VFYFKIKNAGVVVVNSEVVVGLAPGFPDGISSNQKFQYG
jgi:hypothetical protein